MQWISVEDRLPPPNPDDPGFSYFVLFTDGQEIGLGSYEYEYFSEDPNEPLQYSSPRWYDATHLITDNEVTHWMPLPEPRYDKKDN